MHWHLYSHSLFSSQYIESTIVLAVQVLASDQCSNLGIIIETLEFLPIFASVILKVHYIVGCSSLVLLASLIQVHSGLQSGYVFLLLLLHEVPAFLVLLKTFLAQTTD